MQCETVCVGAPSGKDLGTPHNLVAFIDDWHDYSKATRRAVLMLLSSNRHALDPTSTQQQHREYRLWAANGAGNSLAIRVRSIFMYLESSAATYTCASCHISSHVVVVLLVWWFRDFTSNIVRIL